VGDAVVLDASALFSMGSLQLPTAPSLVAPPQQYGPQRFQQRNPGEVNLGVRVASNIFLSCLFDLLFIDSHHGVQIRWRRKLTPRCRTTPPGATIVRILLYSTSGYTSSPPTGESSYTDKPNSLPLRIYCCRAWLSSGHTGLATWSIVYRLQVRPYHSSFATSFE